MAALTPQPFPADGYRKLSAKETMQRAQAMNSTMATDTQPKCSGQVHVGMFFDGTGNNKTADYDDLPPEKRKHSNIVKLFHAYPDAPDRGYIANYIPGVGTAFPEIGEKSTSAMGSAAAAGGAARIIWGLLQVVNAPYRYVTTAPLIPDNQAGDISNMQAWTADAENRKVLHHWQDQLKAALAGKKPHVEQINLSVFGFSRGAAEARVFCNWLMSVCKQENGGWTFAGIPLCITFLGIFDTVASVGAANLWGGNSVTGHQQWADNSLQIHPAIERCVHFVAGHEVRATFPLDSTRIKQQYPANTKEVVYPGSHSDLGGGYAPTELGLIPALDDNLSIIPGMTMYHEAMKSGVPLKAWRDLAQNFKDDLTPTQATIAAFNTYAKDAKISSAAVEHMLEQHMALYLSYRFKYRNALPERMFYKRANKADRGYLQTTQNTIHFRLGELAVGDPNSPDFDPAIAAAQAKARAIAMAKATGIAFDEQDLKTQQLYKIAAAINIKKLTPAIEQLCEDYIHDSMAGFIGMATVWDRGIMNEEAFNSMGIMKFRHVFFGND
ncbi:T6SS phospholipase effector Tle1-like catalytic domain-containing protein [Sulfuriferula nivalis]|uniref:T6SS Phospholipase effector Tle1-like catalytic domain-containing protein n=1 Tax=Sulfuriferula nivalis TaxID=2675298 RepID=A0A809S868_9PROT|nr:DUF2235 domain-containing protein [Sulfuriferula nivalis]BBP00022.1 hypothetical protein SFSGTM_07300 [Sulfuriferula nivalis]